MVPYRPRGRHRGRQWVIRGTRRSYGAGPRVLADPNGGSGVPGASMCSPRHRSMKCSTSDVSG